LTRTGLFTEREGGQAYLVRTRVGLRGSTVGGFEPSGQKDGARECGQPSRPRADGAKRRQSRPLRFAGQELNSQLGHTAGASAPSWPWIRGESSRPVVEMLRRRVSTDRCHDHVG
jgi:hypothetical protein